IAAAAVAQAASAGLAKPVRAPSKPPPETLSAARKAVLRFLLPTLPSALYFSIQGQLTVWFAALLGSTENVAQIGALARLGMLMSLFTGLTTVIFLPRLAAITEEGLYRRRCLQFGAFLALLALAILGFAWLAPRLFLLLLGSHYQHLEEELLIVVAASGLTLLGGYAVAVNTARAWNRWQGLCVLALAASQAVLAALLPLSTTAGLLWFNLGTSAVGLLLQMIVMGFGFLRPRWVHWA
ncbi:MAG TPA: hypothetical protein PK413_05050, partial [Thermoanaerobaculia bacterium]|nr:hypothetical protein [Thermoanaerobaculia bacterium]